MRRRCSLICRTRFRFCGAGRFFLLDNKTFSGPTPCYLCGDTPYAPAMARLPGGAIFKCLLSPAVLLETIARQEQGTFRHLGWSIQGYQKPLIILPEREKTFDLIRKGRGFFRPVYQADFVAYPNPYLGAAIVNYRRFGVDPLRPLREG